jgi:hypothetical protein
VVIDLIGGFQGKEIEAVTVESGFWSSGEVHLEGVEESTSDSPGLSENLKESQ